MTRAKSNNRSAVYQHIFWELPWIDGLDDLCPIDHRWQDDGYSRDLAADLREQLRLEYWRLIRSVCTPQQIRILEYMAQGYTGTEIGHMLGICQSTVVKVIIGNDQYRDYAGRKLEVKKHYGGVRKKLIAAAANDPIIQSLRAQLAEISAGNQQ